MFCTNCGKETADDAKFCANCGTALSGESGPAQSVPEQEDTGGPLLVVKPTFIGWEHIIGGGCLGVFLMFFLGAIGGGALYNMLGVPFSVSLPLAFIICFVGMPILSYSVSKYQYARKEYAFYKNHLEFSHGIFALTNKSLRYDAILKSEVRQGLIQRRYGVGTITLWTAAAGAGGSSSSSGTNACIRIADVQHPERVYKAVQKVISR